MAKRPRKRFLKRLVERRVEVIRDQNPGASEEEIYEFTLDDLEDRFADRPFLKLLIEILLDLFAAKIGS